MSINTAKGLSRLFLRCTFTPVLGSRPLLRRSTIPSSTRSIVQSTPGKALPQLLSQQDITVHPWTKDDDKKLAVLRRKKSSMDEIQIFMAHQPIEAIETRMKQLDEKERHKPTFQRWTREEDERLEIAVKEFGSSNRWKEISEAYFSPPPPPPSPLSSDQTTMVMVSEAAGNDCAISTTTFVLTARRRSPRSCQIRWKFLHPDPLSSAYHAGPWSPEELELFQELVNPEGSNNWDEISRAIGTRSANQCHSQFKTVMHSGTKGKWTMEEINRLLEARDLYGGDWQKVAKHVGTRAPGQVRQKWNQFSDDVLRRLEARRIREAN